MWSSRFFRVQVLQDPGFARSRFCRVRFFWVQFKVQLQGLGPAFRSSSKRNVALCDFEKNKNDKLLSQINNNCNETSCNFISPENNVLLQTTITAVSADNENIVISCLVKDTFANLYMGKILCM